MGWGRRTILQLAGHPWADRTVRRYGRAFGARRFVAGEGIGEAIAAVARLNAAGMTATLDLLGEAVADRAAAGRATQHYLDLLDAVAASGVDSGISLKPTQLGAALDADLCRDHLRRIVQRAAEHGKFVRIDMEGSAHTEATLRLYRELRAEGRSNLGVVVQAYLYRSLPDLEALDDLSPDVRLVKGAYDEPATIAFTQRRDIDANFRRLIDRQVGRGLPTAVATHDEAIIGFACERLRRLGLPADRIEFQMLFGIRPGLQRRLVAQGRRLRIYVPFGPDWYPYLIRRLAERPANLLLVARSLLPG